jgi:hypothetical protein
MCPIYKVSSIIARFADRVNLQIESKLATSEQKQLRGNEVLANRRPWPTPATNYVPAGLCRKAPDLSIPIQVWRSLGTCLKTVQQEVYSSTKLEVSSQSLP